MEIFLKAIGKKIKQMENENISIIKEKHEDGLIINIMDLVYNFGQMLQNIKDNIFMVKKSQRKIFMGFWIKLLKRF